MVGTVTSQPTEAMDGTPLDSQPDHALAAVAQDARTSELESESIPAIERRPPLRLHSTNSALSTPRTSEGERTTGSSLFGVGRRVSGV